MSKKLDNENDLLPSKETSEKSELEKIKLNSENNELIPQFTTILPKIEISELSEEETTLKNQ